MSLVSTDLTMRASPRMSPMLAMLDPMMFPIINPCALLRIAAIEVNNSGAEVAMETMVKPTTTLGTPNAFAKMELWSLNASPPLVSKNKPATMASVKTMQ